MVFKFGRFYIRRRGAFLALIGVVWILIGYSYLSIDPAQRPAVQHALRLAIDVAPLWIHGVVWVVSGVLAVIDGIRPSIQSMVGFTAAVIMPTVWALVYLSAWADGDLPRGWVNAAVYGALAGAIAIVAGMPVVRVP